MLQHLVGPGPGVEQDQTGGWELGLKSCIPVYIYIYIYIYTQDAACKARHRAMLFKLYGFPIALPNELPISLLLELPFSEYKLSEYKLSEYKLSAYKLSEDKLSGYQLSEYKLSGYKLSEYKLSEYKLSEDNGGDKANQVIGCC